MLNLHGLQIKEAVTMSSPVVLITGALTGIGRAAALTFALEGAHLIVSGRRDKEGRELAAELQKLGAAVEINDDSLIIDPPEEPKRAEINTYDDHRMAMSFALAGTRVHGIVIKDAQCVNKTYPGYFEDLKSVLASNAQSP